MSFSTVAGNSTVAQPVESQTGETATFLARHNRVEELLGNIQDAKDKAASAMIRMFSSGVLSIMLGKISTYLLPYSSYVDHAPLSSDPLVIVGANILGPLAVLGGLGSGAVCAVSMVRSHLFDTRHLNELKKFGDMNLQPSEVSKMSGSTPGSMEARILSATKGTRFTPLFLRPAPSAP